MFWLFTVADVIVTTLQLFESTFASESIEKFISVCWISSVYSQYCTLTTSTAQLVSKLCLMNEEIY